MVDDDDDDGEKIAQLVVVRRYCSESDLGWQVDIPS